jgi:hypothetical protein
VLEGTNEFPAEVLANEFPDLVLIVEFISVFEKRKTLKIVIKFK